MLGNFTVQCTMSLLFFGRFDDLMIQLFGSGFRVYGSLGLLVSLALQYIETVAGMLGKVYIFRMEMLQMVQCTMC